MNWKIGGTVAGALLSFVTATAQAELFINEIFFDPPGGSGDNSQEYIELRGTPNMSLDNHYLVFLENENDSANSGDPSQIDMTFDLSGRSLSPSGFFSLRQRSSPYMNPPNGVHNPVNTLPGAVVGWGGTPGVDNNVGASSSSTYSNTPGRIENSGFTAMLIQVHGGGPVPTLGTKLDGSVDNDGNMDATDYDGLDYPNGVPDLMGGGPAWSIVDSIGIFSEGTIDGGAVGEAIYGRTYAKLNFGPEIPGQEYTFLENGVPTTVTFQPNITDDQEYYGLGYEVEQIARWGNSTGETAEDWHITNVTNEALSGFVSANDGFRQSGGLHDAPVGSNDFVETNQFVPYGTNLNNTIGAANFPLNVSQLPWDYNRNGAVDAADYVIWKKTLGQSGVGLPADGNGSRVIDQDDFLFWKGQFGVVLGGFGAGSGSFSLSIPEPATWLLTAMVCCGLAVIWRPRFRADRPA